MRFKYLTLMTTVALLGIGGGILASCTQTETPSTSSPTEAIDPCAGKSDPCAAKADPCAGKADPCAAKTDPCAAKADPCAGT